MNPNFEQITGIDEDARAEQDVSHIEKTTPALADALKRLLAKMQAPIPTGERFIITPQMRAEAKGREAEMRAKLGDDF